MLIRKSQGHGDCFYRINEVLTVIDEFNRKVNPGKEDKDKVIGAVDFLTEFVTVNPVCFQYIDKHNTQLIEGIYKIKEELNSKGGRRKYKKTRGRKAKSKRTRRR